MACETTTGSLLRSQDRYERLVRDNDILNQRLTKAQQDYENQLMNRSARKTRSKRSTLCKMCSSSSTAVSITFLADILQPIKALAKWTKSASQIQTYLSSDQLAGENSQKNAELRLKEEEVASLKAEIGRVNKLREGLQRRLRAVEDQKHEVESTRDSLKQQIAGLDRGEHSDYLTHAIYSHAPYTLYAPLVCNSNIHVHVVLLRLNTIFLQRWRASVSSQNWTGGHTMTC